MASAQVLVQARVTATRAHVLPLPPSPSLASCLCLRASVTPASAHPGRSVQSGQRDGAAGQTAWSSRSSGWSESAIPTVDVSSASSFFFLGLSALCLA